MTGTPVVPKGSPPPLAPYSPGTKAGNTIYVAGTLAIDSDGNTVGPGDVVCADDDGVVVVARSEAAWALERCRQRLAAEEAARVRLAAGELGLDMHGLRQKLVDMGVDWVDALEDPTGG